MLEVIGWELTEALYHAHKLAATPPTPRQREKGTWPEGQHRQFKIETAKLLTELLVIVGEQAAARAKEMMNDQKPNDPSIGQPEDGDNSIEGSDKTEESSEPSPIIIPEGFGH